MAVIRVTRAIAIDESELAWDFVRSSGPGGQNVNKVATTAQLRFHAARSPAIRPDVLERLRRLAGSRMTREGEILITAGRFRTQERNRRDALDRLVDLIRRAARRPKRRKPTRPTAASRERRLQEKRHRSQRKRLRDQPRRDD